MSVHLTTSVTGWRHYAWISDSAGFAAPVHAIVMQSLCLQVESSVAVNCCIVVNITYAVADAVADANVLVCAVQ